MKALFHSKTPGLFLTRYRFLLPILFWTGMVLYDGLIWA